MPTVRLEYKSQGFDRQAL
uniref:Uncharacterized protein n=1 Tax=Arundo donax TaxID=35708 RepID=A0A0A9B9B8_ARUDO